MAGDGKLLHPEVLWAQGAKELYVTISLVDVKDVKLNTTKNRIHFEGVGGTDQKRYGFDLELYDEIKPEPSKRTQTERSIFLVLEKAKPESPYWRSLHKGEKLSFVRTDFSRWKDEDDEEEEEPGSGMDFSSLMGGGSSGDSDDSDEEIPGLEAADAEKEEDGTDKEAGATINKDEPHIGEALAVEKTADGETKAA
jgi:prostaglandin-E synthase